MGSMAYAALPIRILKLFFLGGFFFSPKRKNRKRKLNYT